MEIALREEKERVKVLFTGHRGSGKSTELNRLAMNLDKEFFIAKFSIYESLNFADLNYIDILLVSMLKLLQKAIKEKIKINEGILEHVFNWLHYEITEERVITLADDIGVAGNLNLFVIKMEGKLKQEEVTRAILRKKIEPRLCELIDKINLTIPEIEEKAKKPVLIIVEDIDKVDLEKAQHLFFQHGESLSRIESKVIYTFPIALRYSDDFTQIAKTFSHFILPNVKIFDKQGKEDIEAFKALRDVITRRTEEHLITEDAIREAINLSGGLMIELIELIRTAARDVLANKKEIIDVSDIRGVANEMRNTYLTMLRPEQYTMLKRINEDKEKKPVNEKVVRDCLHNLSLLEYRNDDVWVDVHPIVKPLL
jgi:DNA polymerase III delta prime subunit